MTHLCIANRILALCPETVRSLPQFYLGTLAPDSIHFRSNPLPNAKKITHLCVGEGNWGELTNNAEWQENVLSFLDSHRQSEDFDFIYGFCIHIMADIYNNFSVWTPFRQAHLNELKTGTGDQYHTESAKVDLQLYQNIEQQAEIWSLLEQAHGLTLPGIVLEDDINRMKASILYHQYQNQPAADTSANTLITYNDTLNFIKSAAAFIFESFHI